MTSPNAIRLLEAASVAIERGNVPAALDRARQAALAALRASDLETLKSASEFLKRYRIRPSARALGDDQDLPSDTQSKLASLRYRFDEATDLILFNLRRAADRVQTGAFTSARDKLKAAVPMLKFARATAEEIRDMKRITRIKELEEAAAKILADVEKMEAEGSEFARRHGRSGVFGLGDFPSENVAAAEAKVRRTRNPARKAFAAAYLKWRLGKGPQPTRPADLGVMGEQAARWDINLALTGSIHG